jgi:small subunit ribosomal protein S2
MANTISVDAKKLLEAGAHFGHKTSRWHPAMRPFIHSKRGDTHIIDLTKTAGHLDTALAAITKVVAGGGVILLTSTKRQAKEKIQAVAEATDMPFVVNRWLGGMITNQKTISGRVKHLKGLEERMVSGELAAKFSKLEVQRFQEEIDDMNVLYGGIKNMPGLPAIMFALDIVHDKNAVAEATKLHIPVVALVDTNADPRTIKYPVPCNDDAVKTIELVCDYVQQAIELGVAQRKAPAPVAEAKPASEPAPTEAPKEAVKETVNPAEAKAEAPKAEKTTTK